MKTRKTYCGWCKAETQQIYKLKDGKFLCLECATKHYDCVEKKMEDYIDQIKNGLKKKRNKLQRFKEAMCKHENAINTNYYVGINPSKYIWRCPDCGKTIYKEEFNI